MVVIIYQQLLVLAILQTFVLQFIRASTSKDQVFIQTDNELRFIIDGIPLPISAADSLIFTEKGSYPKRDVRIPVQFSPTLLDFDIQPVGMPKLRKVLVTNVHPTESVHLISISGSTPHFHCSFFQDKIMGPGANTTFDVAFLARQIGNVEHALKIQTSVGVFTYHVFGSGVSNPYRLRPFIGARVPVNGSFSPIISMHNPFNRMLRVVEMFTSGGNLHLELPTGASEASRSVWEIKPFETKHVMRATLVARQESNETGYIRIKTSASPGAEDLLIVPLEVEVSSHPGLYTPQHVIDFGVLHSLSEPRSLPLLVINSSTKHSEITSVELERPNSAVSIDFHPVMVRHDILHTAQIGTVTFTPAMAKHARQEQGVIVISSKTGDRLYVPFTSQVLRGTLKFPEGGIKIRTGDVRDDHGSYRSPIVVTNKFNSSLVVFNVSLPTEAAPWISLYNKTKRPVTLRPLQTVQLGTLHLHPSVRKLQGCTILYVSAFTNVSEFRVPVQLYDGKLKMVFQHSERDLDFGTLGFGENRALFVTLRNDNPVDVEVREVYPTSDLLTVELFGVEKGNGSTLSQPPDWSQIQINPLVLKPQHFAVYKVNLTAPDEEALYSADIRVATNFDTFHIPIKFQTSEGSVKSIPEKIVFENTFPTKIPFKVLKMRSSFAEYTEVTRVSFLPPDSRFRYEATKNTPTVLEPFQDTVIGQLYFDAHRGAKNDCYAGFQLNTPAGQQWVAGLTLTPDVVEVDRFLYKRLWQRWMNIQHKRTVNVTVQIDTDPIRGFLFTAQAHLSWPKLLSDGDYHPFPITQVGNMTIYNLAVANPSDYPVIVQILTLPLYPKVDLLLDVLMKHPETKAIRRLIDEEENDIFTLQNLEIYNKNSSNPVPKYRQSLGQLTGVPPHNETIATILNPGVRVAVQIGFQPKETKTYTSLILIRNNLTVVDAAIVTGRGATSSISVPEAKGPTDSKYLLFEITTNKLKPWLNSDPVGTTKQSNNAYFEYRRTITLTNDQELPVYVHGMLIDREPCTCSGFTIMNCSGFLLEPNSSHKVEMLYYPDFVNPKSASTLTIVTNSLAQNYTLLVSLPGQMLSRCHAQIPRPDWEEWLFLVVTCSAAVLALLTLLLAYVDMRRIFSMSISRRLQREGKVFDLKDVGRLESTCLPVMSPTGRTSFPGVPVRISSKLPLHTQNYTTVELKKKLEKPDTPHALSNGATPSKGSDRKSQQQLSVRVNLSADCGAGMPSLTEVKKSADSRSKSTSSSRKSSESLLNNSGNQRLGNSISDSARANIEKLMNSTAVVQQEGEELFNRKHDHKNNLLKVDNCTNAGSSSVAEGDLVNVSTAAAAAAAAEKTLPMLSEEARAKLQQNSKAQLRKQKKIKLKTKAGYKPAGNTSPPNMVTKGVGTTDFEDTHSSSTESGSINTADRKNKRVSEWLNKQNTLVDEKSTSQEEPAWSFPAGSEEPTPDSDESEAASWDQPESKDDMSEIVQQTAKFHDQSETVEPVRQLEPIGTKVKAIPAAPPVWDFPLPTDALRASSASQVDSPTADSPQRSDFLPARLTMMQQLQLERRRQLELYKAKQALSYQQSQDSELWPGFGDDSLSGAVWDTTRSWQAPPVDPQSWAPSWSQIWGEPDPNLLGTSPAILPQPVSRLPSPYQTVTQSAQVYDPFSLSVWSRDPSPNPFSTGSITARSSIWDNTPVATTAAPLSSTTAMLSSTKGSSSPDLL